MLGCRGKDGWILDPFSVYGIRHMYNYFSMYNYISWHELLNTPSTRNPELISIYPKNLLYRTLDLFCFIVYAWPELRPSIQFKKKLGVRRRGPLSRCSESFPEKVCHYVYITTNCSSLPGEVKIVSWRFTFILFRI